MKRNNKRFLMHYRIAYQAETKVNWCAALGTVLANDEVVDGLSVRGGHPVCATQHVAMVPKSVGLCATFVGKS